MSAAIVLLLALQVPPTAPAVGKGVHYLRDKVEAYGQHCDLVLWTLLAVEVPEADPLVQSLLKEMLSRPLETTRAAALQAMILQEIGPAKYRTRLVHCAQFLADNQGSDGRWDAGLPTIFPVQPPELGMPKKIKVVKAREGPKSGDDLNSRWAAWGLVACDQSGIVLEPDVSAKGLASWRDGEHDPAEAVSCLSVHAYLQGRDWKKHPDVQEALARLAERPMPTDPRSLFVLKRAMIHADRDKLGERTWWPEGVAALLPQQSSDGGWDGIEETCAAVHYLHHRRHKIPEVWPK